MIRSTYTLATEFTVTKSQITKKKAHRDDKKTQQNGSNNKNKIFVISIIYLHENMEKKRVEKSGEKKEQRSNENNVLNNHTHIE